jgi:hypothetical protein
MTTPEEGFMKRLAMVAVAGMLALASVSAFAQDTPQDKQEKYICEL